MSSALTRKSRKLAKGFETTALQLKIRSLRQSISQDTSLLQACEKELKFRRTDRKKEEEEFEHGD